MCLKLEGFCRSEWVSLGSSTQGRWSRRVLVRDERGPQQGPSLPLLLEVVRTGKHALRACLSVEFWLENLSGLPLVYGEPVRAAIETLSGPITSEVILAPYQVRPPTRSDPSDPIPRIGHD